MMTRELYPGTAEYPRVRLSPENYDLSQGGMQALAADIVALSKNMLENVTQQDESGCPVTERFKDYTTPEGVCMRRTSLDTSTIKQDFIYINGLREVGSEFDSFSMARLSDYTSITLDGKFLPREFKIDRPGITIEWRHRNPQNVELFSVEHSSFYAIEKPTPLVDKTFTDLNAIDKDIIPSVINSLDMASAAAAGPLKPTKNLVSIIDAYLCEALESTQDHNDGRDIKKPANPATLFLAERYRNVHNLLFRKMLSF